VLGDGAGAAELSVGAGVGDEVAGDGLLAGDGLSVADELLAGDGLLVGDAAAAGAVAGELAGDDCAADAGTWIGTVVLAAEPGNSELTGSCADAACLAAGVGAGVAAGEATAWICGPSRPVGLTVALVAAPAGKPAELAGTTR
jgi:hypothetical protein